MLIDKGKKTKELAKIIPIENLKAYLYVYQFMKDIANFQENIPESLNLMKEHLYKLCDAGWLNERSAIDISKCIDANLEPDKKVILKKYYAHIGMNLQPETKKRKIGSKIVIVETVGIKESGNYRDYAINFLIYVLCSDMVFYKIKPTYKLITEFLNEQKINLPEDRLQKQYGRLKRSPNSIVRSIQMIIPLIWTEGFNDYELIAVALNSIQRNFPDLEYDLFVNI